jgi:hypothetical protein
LGERLDRTQEVGGSSPPSSIGWRPCYGGASGVLGVGAVVRLGAVGTACGYHLARIEAQDESRDPMATPSASTVMSASTAVR